MNDINLYKKALLFAVKKHANQKRRNGNSYIIHPIRVSQEVKTMTQKIIALLHDTIEDTDTTFEELLEEFGSHIAKCVFLLTHQKGESYSKYIEKVKLEQDSIAVKIADIVDNLSDSPSENAINKCSYGISELMPLLEDN